MRRILLGVLVTIAVVVLLLSYRTSTFSRVDTSGAMAPGPGFVQSLQDTLNQAGM